MFKEELIENVLEQYDHRVSNAKALEQGMNLIMEYMSDIETQLKEIIHYCNEEVSIKFDKEYARFQYRDRAIRFIKKTNYIDVEYENIETEHNSVVRSINRLIPAADGSLENLKRYRFDQMAIDTYMKDIFYQILEE